MCCHPRYVNHKVSGNCLPFINSIETRIINVIHDKIDSKTANSIKNVVSDGIIAHNYTKNALNILKSKRDEIVFKMKLTSKDEFDILSKRVENLENKIKKLETKKKNTKRVKKS